MEYRKSKIVPLLGYIYLILPPLIFCFGWLKWYFIVLVGFAFLVCGFFMFRKIHPIDLVLPNTKKTIIIFAATISFIVLIMILSGVSNNSSQSWDMYWRDSIFTELVKEDWPASMTGIVGGKETRIYLVYYIGFYMPAALIGKVFGLAAGYAFISIWAMIGLTIIYLLLCSYMKKISFWPMYIFLFFSGLDFFNRLIFQSDTFVGYYSIQDYIEAFFTHLEWVYGGVTPYSISSHITQLFWTFNQSVPMFVLLSMVLLGKQEHDIIFFTSTIVLTSTLSCFGLAFIIVALFFLKENGENLSFRLIRSFDELKGNLKKYILNPSVPLAAVLTIFTGLFVISNSNVGSGGGKTGFWIQNPFETFDTFIVFITFISLEVLVYFVYELKNNKKNALLYLTLFGAIVPLHIRLNGTVDIMLKVTTPFMFIFCLLFIFSVFDDYKTKIYIHLTIGITIFLLGSITGWVEIIRLSRYTIYLYAANDMNSLAILFDLLMVVVVLTSIILLFLFKPKKVFWKNGIYTIAPLVVVFSLTMLMSFIVNKGISGNAWNSVCDPWTELYLVNNFSGNPDSLFFRWFAR